MAANPREAAAQIIKDAGGELVGRTRLQKIAFLLDLAGFVKDFSFEYRHYGPYSEDLAQAMEIVSVLGPVREEERVAEWGGRYSIYRLEEEIEHSHAGRSQFVQLAKEIDAVELELAATAAYLFTQSTKAPDNPWNETRRRKPTKALEGRLERAAAAYEKLRQLDTPSPLPELPRP